MPVPEHWKGSDLRSRAEIVQYLHRHGGTMSDPQGLLVGTLRTDLGKGRAVSQLLADMEADGMISREVRGRRTFGLRLVDDWGLLEASDSLRPTGSLAAERRERVPERSQRDGEVFAGTDGHIDYDALAQALLVRAMRAANQPSRGAEVEKWREKAERAQLEVRELKDELIIARDSEAEQRRQADKMREELLRFQRNLDKPRKGTVPLREALSESDRKVLERMMRDLPTGR